MNPIDLSPLVTADNAFDKAIIGIHCSYKTAWDDTVHDSFQRFIFQMDECGRRLHQIRISAELLEKGLIKSNVQVITRQSQRLMQEAEDI